MRESIRGSLARYNPPAMDVRIRERLVGALVLVALVVLVIPALLRGPRAPREPAAEEAGTGSVEIVLDGAGEALQAERLVPEPEPTHGKPGAPAAVLPQAAMPPAAAPVASPGPGAAPDASPAALPVASTSVPQPAWAVQLGAFSTRSKADRLVAKLRARGYSAFVLEYRADGQLLHRVRVGPEQDRARAAAIAERLRNDGFQPVVAPHP